MTKTGDRIAQAALELFAEKGFYATGIRDLADKVGITTASLYYYMGTKDDLLVRLMVTGNQRVLSAAREALTDVHSPESQLCVLVYVHILAHTIYQLETQVIDSEMRAIDEPDYSLVVGIRDAYERLWTEAIAEGVSTGMFSVADPKMTKLALLSMCTGVTFWYRKDGPLLPVVIARQFADLALGAVKARSNGRPLQLGDIDLPDEDILIKIVAEQSIDTEMFSQFRDA